MKAVALQPIAERRLIIISWLPGEAWRPGK